MKSQKKVIETMDLELGKLLITKDGYPLPQGNESIKQPELVASSHQSDQ